MNENDKQAEPVGVTISPMMYRFLMGEISIDGCWFGDRHSTFKGAFWWRSMLRHSAEACTPPTQPVQPAGAQGEPVAYLHHISNNDDSESYVVDFLRTHPLSVDGGDFPLYTAPPAAAINEQLLRACKTLWRDSEWRSRHKGSVDPDFVLKTIGDAIRAAEAEKAKGGGDE